MTKTSTVYELSTLLKSSVSDVTSAWPPFIQDISETRFASNGARREKIAVGLPSKFCLVMDGWSCADTHVSGVFFTFFIEIWNGYSVFLVAFSPLTDNFCLDAQEHVDFLNLVVETYEKIWHIVVAFIEGNCATHKQIVNIAIRTFVGCAAYCFNLVMMIIVRKRQHILDEVKSFVVKLRTLMVAAKLHKHIFLMSKTSCPKKGGSYDAMLKTNFEIKEMSLKLISKP